MAEEHVIFLHLGEPIQLPDASHVSFLVVLSLSSQGVPVGAKVVSGGGHRPVVGMQVPCMRHSMLADGSLLHVTSLHFGMPTQLASMSHVSFFVVSSSSSHGAPTATIVVSGGGHCPVSAIHVPCIRH